MRKIYLACSALLFSCALFAGSAWEKPLREQLEHAKSAPASKQTLQRMATARKALAEEDQIPFMMGELIYLGRHITDFPEKATEAFPTNRAYARGYFKTLRDRLFHEEAQLVQIPWRPYADLFSPHWGFQPDDLAHYTPTLFDFLCFWVIDATEPKFRQPFFERFRASTVRRGLLIPQISNEAGMLMNDFYLEKSSQAATGKALLELLERPGVRGGEAEACVLLAWARVFTDQTATHAAAIRKAIERARAVAQTQISRDECVELTPPEKSAP